MNTEIIEIRKKLKKKLNPERYEHTLGVSYTAACLAMRYGCDLRQAELAGLLHDCARQYPAEELPERCLRHQIPVTEYERKSPVLLHAKLGAWMAGHKYHIEDPEIAGAIYYHTTGRDGMTLLEKIIYTADYIEPRRYKAENLDKIRRLAFQDLDECIYHIMRDTLDYLKRKGGVIDETTSQAYQYYREIHSRYLQQLRQDQKKESEKWQIQ